MYEKQLKQQAFSLLELLLVVLILSVVAGLTVPNFRKTYSNLQLKQTAKDMMYLMRYAQGRSATRARQMVLRFDEDYKKYWLEDLGSSAGSQDGVDGSSRKFSGRLARQFKIPDEVTVEAKTQKINFLPDGTIDKQQINICDHRRCYVLSTKEQRGNILLYRTDSDQ